MRSSLLPAILALLLGGNLATASELWVYIGTYTRSGASEGIYFSRLNLDTGQLAEPLLAGKASNPSFLAIAPDGAHLYAVQEEASGTIKSFSMDTESGLLEPVSVAATKGGAPCHLITDSAGRHVFFANYSGGSAGVFEIHDNGEIKSLTGFSQHKGSSVNPNRQKGPHAHSINLDPAQRYAFVADLGLDQILCYQFNAVSGQLTPNHTAFTSVKPGAGPRHFDFRPDGHFAYVINELHSTITAFSYNASEGALSEIQTLTTLPEDFEGGNSTAHVEVHPSSRFLYGSNRGHDSIAVFSIDPETGKLVPVEIQALGGKTPRNFAIEPSGRYLVAAGQNSNNVQVFRIDQQTGALRSSGSEIHVPSPVCIQFLRPPNNKFTSLFDGQTLEGWEGAEEWFRVENGAIVAGSLKKQIPVNHFLVTEKEFGDFELKLKARLVGEGENAGVQFWSQRIPDHHEVIGFQCDIGRSGGQSIWGALYDESRRRRMLYSVPMPTQHATDFDGWNELRILAKGNVITIWVNGALATQYYENEPPGVIPRHGRFGLQIHSGPPAEAWYKDIQIRTF